MTNNFGNIITCVIPTDRSGADPRAGDRTTRAGHSVSSRCQQHSCTSVESCAGWTMYEAALRIPPQQVGVSAAAWGLPSDSHRSRMTLPPLDLNVVGLGNRQLRRPAMGIEHP
jgi:hypothetical protein